MTIRTKIVQWNESRTSCSPYNTNFWLPCICGKKPCIIGKTERIPLHLLSLVFNASQYFGMEESNNTPSLNALQTVVFVSDFFFLYYIWEFSNVDFGSIPLESEDFFQAYEIYCSKQVTCRENPKCGKMDLNSFILAPVQRIMNGSINSIFVPCGVTCRENPKCRKMDLNSFILDPVQRII
ncbi:hypothetical protein pdam_00009187, partial [Pocillopora damicornis]